MIISTICSQHVSQLNESVCSPLGIWITEVLLTQPQRTCWGVVLCTPVEFLWDKSTLWCKDAAAGGGENQSHVIEVMWSRHYSKSQSGCSFGVIAVEWWLITCIIQIYSVVLLSLVLVLYRRRRHTLTLWLFLMFCLSSPFGASVWEPNLGGNWWWETRKTDSIEDKAACRLMILTLYLYLILGKVYFRW